MLGMWMLVVQLNILPIYPGSIYGKKGLILEGGGVIAKVGGRIRLKNNGVL